MRRVTLFMAMGALLLVVIAGGVAYAKSKGGDTNKTEGTVTPDVAKQCSDAPCYGTSGDDQIFERQGSVRDEIFGCAKQDANKKKKKCRGNSGDDIIDASAFGNDKDVIITGDGKDRINVADGDNRGVVDCGKGNDKVTADVGDRVKSNCEDVTFVT